jgi:hypothetical protein
MNFICDRPSLIELVYDLVCWKGLDRFVTVTVNLFHSVVRTEW